LQLLQSPAVREKLVAKALDNRSDLKAQRLRHQISEAQLTKAKQDLLPQLDLTLVVGRNAQELGDGFGNYTGSVRGDLRGNDATGILKLTYPIGNTSAKGALDAASLEQQTSTITTDDKARTISVQVDTDASTVLRWLQEVDKASQAVDHYSPAIKNAERAEDKLLDNPGTIFNLMDLEDKYTEAFLNQLASWQELGKAIAQLRFQTGTLIKPVGDSEDQWELEALTTIPGIDGNP
jgi:outer membrane protein TolC